MGDDLAIDSGIFDFGNLNFLSNVPAGLGPEILKTRGSVTRYHLCMFVCLFLSLFVLT